MDADIDVELRKRVESILVELPVLRATEAIDPIPTLAPFRQEFSGPPKRVYQHRLSQKANEALALELAKMERMKVITKVDDPLNKFATIAFFSVPKSDGTARIIADARVSNQLTLATTESVPNIEEVLFNIPTHATRYSVVDISKAYYSVPISGESAAYYRFQAPNGVLYEYQRLPMGARNSASAWCRFITQLLGNVSDGLDGAGHLLYMDDIILFSESDNDHVTLLERILRRLSRANLCINRKLAVMHRDLVAFGYRWCNGRRTHCPNKMEQTLSKQKPRTYKALHSLACGLGYYRSSLANWGKVVSSIWAIVNSNKKSATIEWDESTQAAYDNMIKLATEPTPCVGIKSSRGFVLTCDASDVGLGAVLAQEDDNGHLLPIAFYSRALTTAEKSYSIAFLECRSIEQGLLRFETILSLSPVEVRTDSTYAYFVIKSPSYKTAAKRSMLLRILNTISRFNVTVIHQSGKDEAHILTDLLSKELIKAKAGEEVYFFLNDNPKIVPITVITPTQLEEKKTNLTKTVRVATVRMNADVEEFYKEIVLNQYAEKKTKRKIDILLKHKREIL